MALVGSPIGKPWGRRLPVSVGVAGRTYADWVTEANRLATGGLIGWNSGVNTVSANGTFKTTASTPTNGMTGSSWLSAYKYEDITGICRVIQHGLPSQVVFDSQVSEGRDLVISVVSGGNMSFSSLTRNGFTSQAGSTAPSVFCFKLMWWDSATGKVMQNDPSSGTSPTEYVW